MAAYGGHEAVADLGNQIFVTVMKGKSWPPRTCDVRVKYEETIGVLKARAAHKFGVAVDQLQLFMHGKELTAVYDNKTLLDLNIHTGFGLRGYDLTEEPHYWPPVEQTDDGFITLGS